MKKTIDLDYTRNDLVEGGQSFYDSQSEAVNADGSCN